jgi:hypothetical protein
VSVSFEPIRSVDGEEILVSCTLRNGLRVEIKSGEQDWECFEFDSPDQAELVASQLLQAAELYRKQSGGMK